MTVKQILKDNEVTISFEVFPPKTDDKFESVEKASMEIAALKPHFMSVTYGAGGGTSANTAELATRIQDKYQTPVIAHLTCVSSTKATVKQQIEDMKNAGIKNVMALRGDKLPDSESGGISDYKYAVDLIRELKESGGDFCIGGAC